MRRYSQKEKDEILEFIEKHTIADACEKYGVSKYAINCWKGWSRKNRKDSHDKWKSGVGKDYYKDPEVRKRMNSHQRNFRAKNPDYAKESDKKGRFKHRFKKLSEYSNRNFFRRGIKDYYKLTAFDLWKIAKKQKLICPISGIKLNASNISVDHILPISRGGTNEPSNVRLVHKWINLMLGIHTDEDFLKMCRVIVDYNDNRLI